MRRADRQAIGDLLHEHAQQRPLAACCALDDHGFSFGEIDTVADAVAGGFAAAGIRPGDRVATLAPNRVEILELFHGLARAGAVQVPVNAYLRGAFLRHQLAEAQAKAIVTDEPGRETLRPLLDDLPDLELIVHLDDVEDAAASVSHRSESYRTLRDAGAAKPSVRVGSDDVMAIVFTSGTTGMPKGCILSHGYYCRTGQLVGDALRVGGGDRLFSALPLFHAGGQLIVVMTGLWHGIPIQFESGFSASRYLARAEATQSTVAIGVGAMGAALLASPLSEHDRSHAVRAMMVAPMSIPAQVAFRNRFGIEPWTDVYGQTECMPISLTSLDGVRDPAGCGRPAEDLEVRLVDDHGNEVADGEPGEIWLRGLDQHATFNGYWRHDSPFVAGGYHRTGDLARRLPSGAVAFVDRKKDSLRRRGENVSSLELEAAISQHPGISESAVCAQASELGEDDIRAYVVPAGASPIKPADLFEFLKAELPYFAVPRYVDIVDELPRNAVGRVMKHQLRDRPIDATTWDFEQLGLVIERANRRTTRKRL
jgi:crotonobetaine/carnitine-CoA ligase